MTKKEFASTRNFNKARLMGVTQLFHKTNLWTAEEFVIAQRIRADIQLLLDKYDNNYQQAKLEKLGDETRQSGSDSKSLGES